VPFVSPVQVPLDTAVVNVAPQPVTVYDVALVTSFQLRAIVALVPVAVSPVGVEGGARRVSQWPSRPWTCRLDRWR